MQSPVVDPEDHWHPAPKRRTIEETSLEGEPNTGSRTALPVYRNEAHRKGIETKQGWWQHGFVSGLGVRPQWLERVQFAGIIANGRVFPDAMVWVMLDSWYGLWRVC